MCNRVWERARTHSHGAWQLHVEKNRDSFRKMFCCSSRTFSSSEPRANQNQGRAPCSSSFFLFVCFWGVFCRKNRIQWWFFPFLPDLQLKTDFWSLGIIINFIGTWSKGKEMFCFFYCFVVYFCKRRKIRCVRSSNKDKNVWTGILLVKWTSALVSWRGNPGCLVSWNGIQRSNSTHTASDVLGKKGGAKQWTGVVTIWRKIPQCCWKSWF